MSELHNPLFDDQREFLERQKEEYKNALLSDVADLKDQSQKIGKNLLVVGGVAAGVFLLTKMFGGKREESPRKKKKRLANAAKFKGAEDRAWISSIPDVEEVEPLYSAIERTYPALYHPSTGTLSASAGYARPAEEPSMLKSFFKSDLFKILEQQLAAIIMVYLTKMIEQHMSYASEEKPLLVETTETPQVIDVPTEPEQAFNAPRPQL